ncbi:MAG: hypothetical protein AB7P49_02245 [Bdellovibrionales bacterium]
MGVLLPAFLIWALYFTFILHFHIATHQISLLRSEYYSRFMSGKVRKAYPRIQYVMFGDSTARTALNPRQITSHFGVNLALNNGSIQTSYFGLRKYLQIFPPPGCVLIATQYNYKRNYRKFHPGVARFWIYDPLDLQEIWFFSRAHGVFPASEQGWLSFTTDSLRALFRLDDIPLGEIRSAFQRRERRKIREKVSPRRGIEYYRGHQSFDADRVLPESKFFREELHGWFRIPFEPSDSEDFYLNEMARLTAEAGTQLILVPLPVAESDYFEATRPHLRDRNAHFARLAQANPRIQVVSLPETWKRSNFLDFNHFNSLGAAEMTSVIQQILSEKCPAR